MKKKILSVLMSLAFVISCISPAFAAVYENTGTFVPVEAEAITYLVSGKYGIDIVWKNPAAAPVSTTVTLYNADGSLAEVNAAAESVNPHTNAVAAWTTANEWCVKTFYGLSNTSVYYAVIDMNDGTNSGSLKISDITPTGYEKFSGYSFGRASVNHRVWDMTHDLVTYKIDKDCFKSGNSSLKIHSYGFERALNNVGNRADLIGYLWFNSFATPADSYFEYKYSYKGDNTPEFVVEKASVVSTKQSTDENGWTNVTEILKPTENIILKVNIPSVKGKTVWIDDMSVRKINDYDETAETYTSVGDNILFGGGFDTEVEELKMYEEKELTWKLPDGLYVNAINVYKTENGTTELLASLPHTKTGEKTPVSYTIPDDKWNKDALYTVKTVPCSGGGSIYADCGTEKKESDGVSVRGISDIEIVNYDGAKPCNAIAKGADGAIDVLWDMPSESGEILQVKIQAIDADGDAAASKITSAAKGSKNNVCTLTGLSNGVKYDILITIIYSDKSAGQYRIVNVNPDLTADKNKFGEFPFGGWSIACNGSDWREVYNAELDENNYITGTGSLKVDFRGYINAETGDFQKSAPGNNYMRIASQVNLDTNKYYEISVTYKSEGMAAKIKGGDALTDVGSESAGWYVPFTSGGEEVYKTSEVNSEGWTTVKALVKPPKTAFYPGIHNEYNAGGVTWIDNYSVKSADYNAENKTYAVTDNTNLLVGGDFSLNVYDAVMDEYGTIEWKEIDSEVIGSVLIYDTDGVFYEEIDSGIGFAFVDDLNKSYVIKVKSCDKKGIVSEAVTSGTAVKTSVTEDFEIGNIMLVKNETSAEVSVTVKNNNLEQLNACLILAVYDSNNRFVKCITDKTTLLKNSAEETLSIQTSVSGTDKVKAMLFDSLETMVPLSPAAN